MNLLAYLSWKTLPRIPLGPLKISPHGIGIAIGFALGGQLLARRAERLYGIAREHIWNMLMWAVLGVVVGARLFYVAGHLSDFFPARPWDVFAIQNGGIVLYGGILGGIVAAYPYARKHGLPYLKLLDAAAPGFPLGIIFGRMGDLIIGDHLGAPTTFFLGWRYQGGIDCSINSTIDGCLPDRVLQIGDVVHQTALYDLLIASVLFPLVLLLGRRARPTGNLIMSAAILYAIGRFFTDFARTQAATFLGVHGTQWVSIALIVTGTVFLIRKRNEPVPQPSDEHALIDEPVQEEAPDASDEKNA